MHKKPIFKWSLIILLVWFVFFISLQVIFRPSHDRDWEMGHEALPSVTIENDKIIINNYRNFSWVGPFEAEPNYTTRSFNFSDIEGVDVVISHFDEFEGLAHIFLSFRIKDQGPVSVSLETRREIGEKFSPFLGILRQFEIIYVVGDERDLVGVRTEHRDERVYLYPTKATAVQAQSLFSLLVEDINLLYDKPRMYNTLLRNCTNSITRRVEDMSEVNFPLTYKTVLPGYFDEVLYELGIIDNSLPFEETKMWHRVTNALADPADENFSSLIRRK
jgi:hypothetical protein